MNKIWFLRTVEKCKRFLGNDRVVDDPTKEHAYQDQITATWNDTFVTFWYKNTLTGTTVPTDMKPKEFEKECDEGFKYMQRLRLIYLQSKITVQTTHGSQNYETRPQTIYEGLNDIW